MRDEDIADIFDIAESTLKKHCSKELKKGRTIAKAEIHDTAYELAKSGQCPAMTMFWLKTRDQWYETKRYINETTVSDNKDNNETKEMNLNKLNKDERTLFKKFLQKVYSS